MHNCLIVGAELSALRAARDLASSGIHVTMLMPSDTLGEYSALFKPVYEADLMKDLLGPLIAEVRSRPNVTLLPKSGVKSVTQQKSTFKVSVTSDSKTHEVETSTIILSGGLNPFDASLVDEYKYGSLRGVVTTFDLERSFQAGDYLVQSTMERVAFVLCVGSRHIRNNPDCSTFCCNYAIVQAIRVKEKFPDIQVFVYYMDIRAIARQEYQFNKARKLGVIFVRGRPAEVEQVGEKLTLHVEDTLTDNQHNFPYDLVVLSVGASCSPLVVDVARGLGVDLSDNNFVRVKEKPVIISVEGVFAAGSSGDGVKNIQQEYSEGGAASMAVIQFLRRSK